MSPGLKGLFFFFLKLKLSTDMLLEMYTKANEILGKLLSSGETRHVNIRQELSYVSLIRLVSGTIRNYMTTIKFL